MMQPSSLLLVDADTRSLETLTFGFEREGCKVSGTSDLAEAAQLVRTASPELAVIALRPADRSALEVIGGLRGAAGAGLTVVALGPSALKPDALAAGAADFLPLPIFLRDVISVGRLSALESKQDHKPGADAAAPEEIQMRLSEYFGLFYLLRAMAASERSGVLTLTRGNRRAELRVHEGAVVSANVGALQGLSALHHVLLWEEAALSLTRRPIRKRSQLHLSSQEVLDECERFLRDFAHAVRDLGSPRTLYVPAADPTSAMPGLQPSQVTPLLRLFDGHRVLSDVIEESPFRIFDTVRMIRRLRDGGALAARPDGLVREPVDDRARVRPASSHNGAQKSMLAEWAMVPDQRGVVGNRRSSSRRLQPIGVQPPRSRPTPIPLTTRKGSTTAGEIPAVRRKPTPARAGDLAVAPTVQVRLDASGMPLSAPQAPSESTPFAPQKTPPPARVRNVSARQATVDGQPLRPRSVSARQIPLESEPPPQKTPVPIRARNPSGRQVPLEGEPPPQKTPVPIRARGPSGRQVPLEGEPPPRIELTPRPRRITGGPQGGAPDAFDAIEADFFAREADLYKREAIETFDDLDPVGGPSAGGRSRKK
jgi:ActR/RegA family two-component response regulator